jgi:SAM-dependent MidA family methyltransferase
MQSSTARLILGRNDVTPLGALLAEQIREHGPSTFADYMEACLYHLQCGYYATTGRQPRCDYFTSVDVGPLFGRLLARQFEEMWIQLGRPDPCWLVEAGAGTGTLAKCVLNFTAESFPYFYAALRYIAVELSEARRAVQTSLLREHTRAGRFSSAADLPAEIAVGCIFSNELLDAMPVHRVVQECGELRELYVAADAGRFRDQVGPLSSPRIAEYFAEQGIVLHEGQQAEAGLAACDWIRDAGKRLRRGFVLTIDYGREARELYDERHMRGTLLAYERHRASEEFYRAPGEQDLTAHVNFTALELWGKRSGLIRTGLTTQSNFLLALARSSKFGDVETAGASEQEKTRTRLLFKTLIHPEGMGETFQVFIQHKGVDSPRLSGLEPL